jgi:Ser/Thr protein kinase RdoA (MazF antagonist)
MTSNRPGADVLSAWNLPPDVSAEPLEGGLINKTWRLEHQGTRRVLQRLHPIFKAEVHLDIEPITAHLQARGMTTPRLIRTRAGELWTTDVEGHVWRMLSFVEGRVVEKVPSPAVAHAAGALVGRFHSAVADLQHTFHFTRPGAHDTPAHLQKLRRALDEKRDHADYARIAPLGESILKDAASLPTLPSEPRRLIHGDLKISNLMFNADLSAGVALLDLDTMAHLTIPVELGDALRSWCNPAGEDAEHVAVDAAIFEAAIRGYAPVAQAFLTAHERDLLVVGTQVIALELSARFCADALYENYFGWNPAKYASRSHHNRVRAHSQHQLSRSVGAARSELEAVVRRAFHAGTTGG